MNRKFLISAAAAACLFFLAACGGAPAPNPSSEATSAPATAVATGPSSTPRSLPTIRGAAVPTPAETATVPPEQATPAPTEPGPPVQSGPPVQAGPTAQPSPTASGQKEPPGARPPDAQAFPDPAAYTWQTVANGFTRPVAVSGDRQGRLLVVEQPGVIWVVENGATRQEPFLDIRGRVGSEGNEQGLLGLALHPDYLHNGFLYVNYTDLSGNTVIARFTADPAAARSSPDSQKVLLQLKQPYPNHNGGSMVFGPDGLLYMGLGDGGSGGDPQGNGQNVNVLLGKLLRIDVDHGDPYAIPAGNPFQAGGGKAEIWAYGLRNPWRFSFDRVSGDLYIGDVGQNAYEEIDYQPAGSKGGANFGWNVREGLHPFQDNGVDPAGMVDPIFEYKHPAGCSVTGGYVYRGTALPEFEGIYLLADYCNGKIWGLLRGADGVWQNQLLFNAGVFVSSFGQDDQGELYLTDHQNGAILKLVKK